MCTGSDSDHVWQHEHVAVTTVQDVLFMQLLWRSVSRVYLADAGRTYYCPCRDGSCRFYVHRQCSAAGVEEAGFDNCGLCLLPAQLGRGLLGAGLAGPLDVSTVLL